MYSHGMYDQDRDMMSPGTVARNDSDNNLFHFPTPPIGNTALHKAAYKGHEHVVKLLLDRGADPNALNGSGSTALQ